MALNNDHLTITWNNNHH